MAKQSINSTETTNASFAASIQQLEDRLMSSLSNKLETTAAAISNTKNSNFRNQPFRNRFSHSISQIQIQILIQIIVKTHLLNGKVVVEIAQTGEIAELLVSYV